MTRDAPEILVAAAAAWHLAALLLERPRPEWRDEITALGAEVADRQLHLSAAAVGEATEETYHRLFGPGGIISPREVSYCGFEDPGQLMSELAGFYRAFAFTPRREDSIDHISVEVGLVSYLLLKQAYAEKQNDSESARLTREARARFIQQHLERCVRGMTDRLPALPAYLHHVFSWLETTQSETRSRESTA